MRLCFIYVFNVNMHCILESLILALIIYRLYLPSQVLVPFPLLWMWMITSP